WEFKNVGAVRTVWKELGFGWAGSSVRAGMRYWGAACCAAPCEAEGWGMRPARIRLFPLGPLVPVPRLTEEQCGVDPPPLKWSDLRYVFDIQEDCNGKEAIQA